MRERIAEILNQNLGWRITARNIYPVTGFWKRQDVYRWEVYGPGGSKFGCWLTMREFIKQANKHGCFLDGREIESNEPKP